MKKLPKPGTREYAERQPWSKKAKDLYVAYFNATYGIGLLGCEFREADFLRNLSDADRKILRTECGI